MENYNALSYNIMQVIVGLVQVKAELELDLFPAHVCQQVSVNFCAMLQSNQPSGLTVKDFKLFFQLFPLGTTCSQRS